MKMTRWAIAALLLTGMQWLGTATAEAATCMSVGSGNWNARATWGAPATGCVGAPGGIPGAADTATIANTHTVTVNINASVSAVTVNAGGVLNVSAGGGRSLTVAGATNVSGTLTVNNTTTLATLTVNAGGTVNVAAGNISVNGATSVSGTLAHVTSTAGTKTYIGLVTVNAGGVWSNAINEAVTFRGGITNNGTFNSGTATQTFNTNSQAIGGGSPVNFGGAVAVTGNITITNTNTNVVTIAGNLTGSTAGSTWVNAANATLNYGSASAPMGTRVFTASAAGNTVNYTRAGAQTVKLPSANRYYHLTLSGSGAKTLPPTAMTISGNFTLSGTATTAAVRALTVGGNFTVGAGTTFAGGTNLSHSVAGNFSNSGTFTANTSRFTFNGSVAQSLTGATTFYNVTMNNAAGLTINSNVTVSNILTLTNGVITTGSNTLIASTSVACSTSIVRTSGHVAGNLQKRIPTGASVSCTFQIGDATTYRPINTTFAPVTTAGNVTGWSSQSAGDHPDTTAVASGVDPALSVNRYWTLTNSGVAFTACSATFNFVAGDLDGGAAFASFIVALGSSCSGSGGSRTCGAWALPTVGTRSATSTQATGLTTFGDFAIGQYKKPNFLREKEFIYTRERY